MSELLLWRWPVARAVPFTCPAQPRPGRGSRTEQRRYSLVNRLWHLPPQPAVVGSEPKPLRCSQVCSPPWAHQKQVTGKYPSARNHSHTGFTAPGSHTASVPGFCAPSSLPPPATPTIHQHVFISLWKTYLHMLVKCVYMWEINLSLEGTSHLHRRAQSHKENPNGDQKRSLMLEGSLQ